jgi:hypothetical protein
MAEMLKLSPGDITTALARLTVREVLPPSGQGMLRLVVTPTASAGVE